LTIEPFFLEFHSPVSLFVMATWPGNFLLRTELKTKNYILKTFASSTTFQMYSVQA